MTSVSEFLAMRTVKDYLAFFGNGNRVEVSHPSYLDYECLGVSFVVDEQARIFSYCGGAVLMSFHLKVRTTEALYLVYDDSEATAWQNTKPEERKTFSCPSPKLRLVASI